MIAEVMDYLLTWNSVHQRQDPENQVNNERTRVIFK